MTKHLSRDTAKLKVDRYNRHKPLGANVTHLKSQEKGRQVMFRSCPEEWCEGPLRSIGDLLPDQHSDGITGKAAQVGNGGLFRQFDTQRSPQGTHSLEVI